MSLSSRFLKCSLTLASLSLPAITFAQQQPDAGQTLQQQQQQVPQLPRTGPTIDIISPVPMPTTPGGSKVTVHAVQLNGNTVISEAELLVVLGDYAGQTYDLAGLRGLAERISSHYRDAGYPFARAYLPQQAGGGGMLRIEIVEGRYGKVQTLGDKALAAYAADFLSPLKPSTVINSETLERATLILDDQPGIKVAPIIRPGQEVGTGDLDVRIEREPGFSGDVGFDNHGNRYTGEHRLRANVQWDSPFTFGDQITLRSLLSDEGMWLGSLGYSLPLGGSGLRGNVGYSHTSYELGKDFANLQSTGTAKAASLGVSYPIIRSQRANLTVAASYQHKKLNDKQGLASTNENKSSDSLPITLQFDQRDGLGGGGITYGSLAYTPGRLKLDTALTTTDQTSGQNTRGRFDKWNLDIARVQALSASFTGFGRVSAQWAGKNLDSSEGFSLGGANGVRGYPSGEGNGDEGWMAQLELRYAMGAFNPYVFHDSGRVKINADTGSLAVAPNTNHRSIGSFGVGTRYTEGNINLDASLAWRTHGGQPQSDTADRDTRAWVTVWYKF